MRFRGQRHSLKIDFSPQDGHAALRERFLETYRRQYGHVDERGEVELIGVRVSVSAATRTPGLRALHRAAATGDPRPTEMRDVYAVTAGKRLPTPVFSRDDLPIGFSHAGPVIVEEFGSTTVVGPGESIRVGDLGEIWVDLATAE
jgi:N-methylhydantoinase A